MISSSLSSILSVAAIPRIQPNSRSQDIFLVASFPTSEALVHLLSTLNFKMLPHEFLAKFPELIRGIFVPRIRSRFYKLAVVHVEPFDI